MLAPRVHKGGCRGEVYGQRLQVGDLLQMGDFYECRTGRWRRLGLEAHGHRLEGRLLLIVVRPVPVATLPPKF